MSRRTTEPSSALNTRRGQFARRCDTGSRSRRYLQAPIAGQTPINSPPVLPRTAGRARSTCRHVSRRRLRKLFGDGTAARADVSQLEAPLGRDKRSAAGKPCEGAERTLHRPRLLVLIMNAFWLTQDTQRNYGTNDCNPGNRHCDGVIVNRTRKRNQRDGRNRDGYGVAPSMAVRKDWAHPIFLYILDTPRAQPMPAPTPAAYSDRPKYAPTAAPAPAPIKQRRTNRGLASQRSPRKFTPS